MIVTNQGIVILSQKEQVKMILGETLLLRQQRFYRYLPTVAIYLGKRKVGKFPFSRIIYQVKDKFPIGDIRRESVVGYETLTLLKEDYQTIAEWEEEEIIRQRLKVYCTR